ncbi:MAG: hypothetical protein CMF51_04810 [Legionellales bacterium]|nr:hypothetical protein [Legionellales bacterium]
MLGLTKSVKQIKWTGDNVLRLTFPMLAGYVTSNVCWDKISSKRAGASVVFRPPPAVFKFVWPILYLLLGLSWILSATTAKRNCVLELCYISISVLLASWLYLYGCKNKKVMGVYAITLSMGAVILAMNLVGVTSRVLLVPLLTWLILALLLNVFEVQR